MPLAPPSSSHEQPTGKLVYVAHCNGLIATTFAAILETKGLHVKAFTRPREVIQAAQLLPPDLLVADAVMPEMNGVELALHVAQLQPRCKVLLLSGGTGAENMLTAAHDKGHHFESLPSPLHPKELIANVLRVLDEPPPSVNG
jgi:DNA-binding NtrC family response regulator